MVGVTPVGVFCVERINFVVPPNVRDPSEETEKTVLGLRPFPQSNFLSTPFPHQYHG